MAVYERNYKRYTGPMTPAATRFLILPRYAIQEVFKNRWMTFFFILCLSYPIFCLSIIYLANNASFLSMVPNFQLTDILTINGEFFHFFLQTQGWNAFFLALFMGPGLVSKDLANNGLSLYLSRPFSRTEYVVGKLTVLAGMLSVITWVVGFLLLLIHTNFVGISWLIENSRLMIGMFVGSWIWILTLSLMALAVSAWVRWKPVAAVTMLAVLLGGLFFGNVINAIFNTEMGTLVNLISLIDIVWASMLGVESGSDLSVGAAMLMIGLFWGILLWMLNRRIRAYEVVS